MCKHTKRKKCKQVGRRTKHNLAEKTNMSINVQLDVSIRYPITFNITHIPKLILRPLSELPIETCCINLKKSDEKIPITNSRKKERKKRLTARKNFIIPCNILYSVVFLDFSSCHLTYTQPSTRINLFEMLNKFQMLLKQRSMSFTKKKEKLLSLCILK